MTSRKWFARGKAVKSSVILAFFIIAMLVAIDRFGPGYSSLAAVGNKEKSRITRADCSYLHNPEDIKEAMAQHREEVSRATTEITKSIEHRSEASLVPPQDIPRKNFIDNI